MNYRKIGVLVLRIIAAIILLQTLYFKFTGQPESIFIFSTVGMEPWGRYTVGVMELIAAVLLLIPKLYWLGGLLGTGLMAGALFFHLTILGISVQGDGGYLFVLALVVFIASIVAVVDKRRDIPILKNLF